MVSFVFRLAPASASHIDLIRTYTDIDTHPHTSIRIAIHWGPERDNGLHPKRVEMTVRSFIARYIARSPGEEPTREVPPGILCDSASARM